MTPKQIKLLLNIETRCNFKISNVSRDVYSKEEVKELIKELKEDLKSDLKEELNKGE